MSLIVAYCQIKLIMRETGFLKLMAMFIYLHNSEMNIHSFFIQILFVVTSKHAEEMSLHWLLP
jgi:hypothetical protein